ncbi:hypothetical protein TELCIR_02436 [Teladorsagia circumcincta]|uniref:Uncharacterized protein n=1 Tax=Teladorsagia circumcincta TaxID=45464 RepID=A0A2G9V0N2_TELCI|nr:hypothetical protein TELCIR_02436 [Teladorsagia circumcincta]
MRPSTQPATCENSSTTIADTCGCFIQSKYSSYCAATVLWNESRPAALLKHLSSAISWPPAVSTVIGDPIHLVTEEPWALFGLQVLVMVCVCCRCCVCCKCGRGVSDVSSDEPYNIPGAKHIPVPVRGKSRQKHVKHTRSASHEVAGSSGTNVIDVKCGRAVSALSFWDVPLDVDVVPLHTKPVTVSDESLPWIDDNSQDDADCCRQKRKPGFRPLRGSSVPRWFGGTERTTPERGQTVSPPRAVSPNRDENDYATIDRIRYGKRESSMPASPRNVRFTEEPLHAAARAQMQYRPRAFGNPRGPGSRSTQQSLTQLDEATLDLLRLSSDPDAGAVSFTSSRRVNPAADYLPKAASTSSVNKVIRTAQGGRLHVAKVHTWGVESDDEVLDARHQFNGLPDLPDLSRIRSSGLSPQAIRRNEMQMRESRDEFVDERQAYALSPPPPRRRSDTVGANYSMPSNGYMGESPVGSPYAPRRHPAAAPTSPYSVPQRQAVAAPTSPYSPQRPAQPPVPRHQEQPLSPTGTRRVETIVDYEKKKQGPPVVRTTVEGKLRMEKIVGADLITVDSCVSSAWTVRDTVTNYKGQWTSRENIG